MFKFYGNSNSKKQNSSSSSNDKTDNLTNDNTDIYDNKNESCDSQLFGKRKVLSSNQLLTSKNDADIVPNFMSINEIKYVFSLLDVNCDGQVELKEMSEMLTNLGLPIANEALDYILSSASRKGESKICEQEFCDWIARFVGIEPNDKRVSQQTTSPREKSNLLSTKASLTSSSCQQLVAPIDEATAELVACSSPSERRRRGSGSGNALLRSLSSSSLAGVGLTSKEEATTSSSKSQALSQRRKGSVSGKFGSSSSKSKKSSSSLKDNSKSISDAEADLRAAFCVFDIDGDGYMTIDEVEAALKLMGENWSQAELKNIFSKKITNSDNSKQQHVTTTTISTTSTANQKKTTTTNNNQESRISIDEFVKHLL